MMRPKLLVLDVDGALVATHERVGHTVRAVLASKGFPRVQQAYIEGLTGLPAGELFRRMIPPPQLPIDPSDFVPDYIAAQCDGGLAAVQSVPLAEAALDALRGAEVPVAVFTSRDAQTLATLRERFPWLPTVDAAPKGRAAKEGAPHPAPLLRFLEAQGVTPDEALLVTASAYDLTMAKKAGVATLGLTTGAHHKGRLKRTGAGAVFASWDHLLSHLGISLEKI